MSNGKNREAAEKGCFNNWLHDMTGAEGGGQTGQIAVDGGKTRVINRKASGIGGVQNFWIQWSGTA